MRIRICKSDLGINRGLRRIGWDEEAYMKKWNRIMRHVVPNTVIALVFVVLAVVTFGASRSVFAFAKQSDTPYYKGNAARGEVALINVYWGTEYLAPMLQTLEEYGAKCTFFVGGSWADDHNAELLEIAQRGHEIGNHGYFHKDHKQLSYQANKEEIAATNSLVRALIGKDMDLFAPPSGSFGQTTLSVAKELGMRVIMWSKDTIDWRDKDAELVYSRATKNVEAGDMILMHPTAHTAQAVPKILAYYKEKGLRAVCVTQILSETTI